MCVFVLGGKTGVLHPKDLKLQRSLLQARSFHEETLLQGCRGVWM